MTIDDARSLVAVAQSAMVGHFIDNGRVLTGFDTSQNDSIAERALWVFDQTRSWDSITYYVEKAIRRAGIFT